MSESYISKETIALSAIAGRSGENVNERTRTKIRTRSQEMYRHTAGFWAHRTFGEADDYTKGRFIVKYP